MPFFPYSHDFSINNAQFYDVGENMTSNDTSRHTTNINSNNRTTNNTTDSYNTYSRQDNSTHRTYHGSVRRGVNTQTFTQNNNGVPRRRGEQLTSQLFSFEGIRPMSQSEEQELENTLAQSLGNLNQRLPGNRPQSHRTLLDQSARNSQANLYDGYSGDQQEPVPSNYSRPDPQQYYSAPEVPSIPTRRNNPFLNMMDARQGQQGTAYAPTLTHSRSAPAEFESFYDVDEDEAVDNKLQNRT
ncbi:hypothetical protein BDQ17DRAFT_1423083 [Cyathus striatus]|nr:hypothetical protein BDQ17DRAFT_1423083 [Cyathus striatus]